MQEGFVCTQRQWFQVKLSVQGGMILGFTQMLFVTITVILSLMFDQLLLLSLSLPFFVNDLAKGKSIE